MGEKRKSEKEHKVKKKSKKEKKEKRVRVEETLSNPTSTATTTEPTSTSPKQDPKVTELKVSVTDLSNKKVDIQPHLNFTSLPLEISKNIKFEKPTLIQSWSWPCLLMKRDVVGIASTGSGKTMAFGIPALMHIQSLKHAKPKVLVLSPTRELAMQIEQQFQLFSNAKCVCVYGGVPKYPQIEALQKGMDCIIATPGRLIDLFEQDDKVCDLSQVSYLVLDEADRMLDQGFEESIKKIIAKLPIKRQTIMFSATWPTSIQKLAHSYLQDPIKITIGSEDLTANSRIEQRVEVLDPREKESRLLQLLKEYHDKKNRILIFALYKKEAARLESMLKRNGYKVGAIHGDLSQESRTRALEQFKSGACPLLIATDVAARGIDIPNVEYVINVTFPLTVEDYCHRIGRTGRAGKSGISHTLFTIQDKSHSGGLINVLKQANQVVPDELFKFGTTVKKKVDPNYGAFYKEVDMNVKGSKITFDSDSE